MEGVDLEGTMEEPNLDTLRTVTDSNIEKHGGLSTVTQKRSQSHTAYISATGVSPWVST